MVCTASLGTVRPPGTASPVTMAPVTADPVGGSDTPDGRARMIVAPLSAPAPGATPVTTASNSPLGPVALRRDPARTWAARAGGALKTSSIRAGLVTSATTPPWGTKPPGPTCTEVTTPEIGLVTLSRPEAFGDPAAEALARAARADASALSDWAREVSTSCRATTPWSARLRSR